jgi:hypothetical protein
MDLFNMQLFNHKLFRAKTQSSKLVLYISSTVITGYLMNATNTVDSEEQVEIDESLPKALDKLLKKHTKHKGVNNKTPVYILMDDYFLNMHRLTLNNIQLKTLAQTIDIEIDNIHDYEWDKVMADQESKGKHTALIFMLKKDVLASIENVINAYQLKVRNISPRYLAIKQHIQSQGFHLDKQRLNAIIDISDTRARLFFVLNQKIKLYRRVTLQKIEQKKKTDLAPIKQAFKTIAPLYRTAKDQYTARYTNQEIHHIYVTTDLTNITELSETIDQQSVIPIADKTTGIKYPEKFRYISGYLDCIQEKNSFNMVPFQERLEQTIIRKVAIGACAILFSICLWAGGRGLELKKEYDRYDIKASISKSQQLKEKRQRMVERNVLKEKKELIEYMELIEEITKHELPINDILYQMTTITTPDIELSSLSITKRTLRINGTSSALNGNYTFYQLLQRLEDITYLSTPEYTLGMKDAAKARFSINLNWIRND